MKKRYQVALTVDHVTRFQQLSLKLGMPKSVMSTVLDDSLKTVTESMEKMMEFHSSGKTLTLGAVFTELGRQMDKMESEEKIDVESSPKTKAVAKKSSRK